MGDFSPTTQHKRVARPRWIPPSTLAAYLGVTPRTVRQWIADGILRGDQTQRHHYADGRIRKTTKGKYRVFEADIRDFMTRYRSGAVPKLRIRWRR